MFLFCVIFGLLWGGFFFNCQDYDLAVFIPYNVYEVMWKDDTGIVGSFLLLRFRIQLTSKTKRRPMWMSQCWPTFPKYVVLSQSLRKIKPGTCFSLWPLKNSNQDELVNLQEKVFACVSSQCHNQVLSFLSPWLITTICEASSNETGFFFQRNPTGKPGITGTIG